MNDQQRSDVDMQASVSDEERERMIAAGAWFRAMQRGFQEGNPLDDWLEAETEVDGSVQRGSAAQRDAEYETDRWLRWAVADRFKEGDIPDAEQILAAIDEVVDEMTISGEYQREVVTKVATTFRKDLANWAEHGAEQADEPGMLVGSWQERGRLLLEQARETLDQWRDRISGYLQDHRTYVSGEVVAPGGFTCTHCGARLEMEHSGHLRHCGNCYHTRFKRIWKL